MADPNYINSQSVDWPKFYSGILPSSPQPTYQSGMLGRGLPASMGQDRLPQGTAGLPNPSPGSGLTPQQLQALGGWVTDPLTGQLAYTQPSQNGAVNAVNGMAQSVPMPRPRPPYAPTTIDMAAINAQQGANPGMGGAMIGNGVMSPGISPQQPPADGSSPLPKWKGDIFGPMGGPPNNGTVARANGTNGYVYGQGANGGWQQQGKTDWATANGNPATQYLAANMRGQLAALQRQANATGLGTNGYVYVNGVNMGQSAAMQGLTPSEQYAMANGQPLPSSPINDGPSTGTNPRSGMSAEQARARALATGVRYGQ